METLVRTVEDIKIVEIVGEIDTKSAPILTQNVLELVEPNKSILLDMTEVKYMSSAGLRMLLSLHRNTTTKQAKLVLVGLSEELRDTMSMTGFLDFFTTCETVEKGLQALQ